MERSGVDADTGDLAIVCIILILVIFVVKLTHYSGCPLFKKTFEVPSDGKAVGGVEVMSLLRALYVISSMGGSGEFNVKLPDDVVDHVKGPLVVFVVVRVILSIRTLQEAW